MAITASDIHNQSFSIDRKGYDVDEVDVFLEHVADEIDILNDTIAHLQDQLEADRFSGFDAPAASTVAITEVASATVDTSEYDAQLAQKDAIIADLERQLSDKRADDNAIAQALIIAQRSADEILAKANANATETIQDARDEAQRIIDRANTDRQDVIDAIRKLHSYHAIILAKNEPAKAFGIKTAETIWQAKRKCPDLRLVAPHRSEYVKFSRKCNELYLQYTDLVDPFGIDESFLDVTGSMHLFGSGEHIADELRRRMREEVGLTISVGVSFNRAFAKLGSDYKKPDGTTVFSRENFKQRVWTLPANTLLYVGKRASDRLNRLGVRTIGELAACDPAFIHSILGKNGDLLLRYARGEDDEPVRSFYAEREVKSVGIAVRCRAFNG